MADSVRSISLAEAEAECIMGACSTDAETNHRMVDAFLCMADRYAVLAADIRAARQGRMIGLDKPGIVESKTNNGND